MVAPSPWTSRIVWIRPAKKRIRSLSVVLPESMWAKIPMFRWLARFILLRQSFVWVGITTPLRYWAGLDLDNVARREVDGRSLMRCGNRSPGSPGANLESCGFDVLLGSLYRGKSGREVGNQAPLRRTL